MYMAAKTIHQKMETLNEQKLETMTEMKHVNQKQHTYYVMGSSNGHMAIFC